jgi:hypothetical protein
MRTDNINSVGPAARSPARPNLSPATKPRTSRQRQIDELYELYDLAMIECLLKRPPSLDSNSGA